MSEQPAMSVEDKKWQAKSDAQTLADANVILEDKVRLKAAKQAAKDLAKDAKARFEAMLRVANKGRVVEGMKVVEKD